MLGASTFDFCLVALLSVFRFKNNYRPTSNIKLCGGNLMMLLLLLQREENNNSTLVTSN